MDVINSSNQICYNTDHLCCKEPCLRETLLVMYWQYSVANSPSGDWEPPQEQCLFRNVPCSCGRVLNWRIASSKYSDQANYFVFEVDNVLCTEFLEERDYPEEFKYIIFYEDTPITDQHLANARYALRNTFYAFSYENTKSYVYETLSHCYDMNGLIDRVTNYTMEY